MRWFAICQETNDSDFGDLVFAAYSANPSAVNRANPVLIYWTRYVGPSVVRVISKSLGGVYTL